MLVARPQNRSRRPCEVWADPQQPAARGAVREARSNVEAFRDIADRLAGAAPGRLVSVPSRQETDCLADYGDGR